MCGKRILFDVTQRAEEFSPFVDPPQQYRL